MATSKSKHIRKRNQFRLKAKRRKERAKKVLAATAAPPSAPQTPKG